MNRLLANQTSAVVFRTRTGVGNPQSNSRMDSGSWSQMNRVSYVNNSIFNVYMVSYSESLQNGIIIPQFSRDANVFGFANMLEAVQLDDFGVYKDRDEFTVYLRDRVLGVGLQPPTISFSTTQKLNFRVHRREGSSRIYDLIVCTRNNAPNPDQCSLYEINTLRATSLSNITYTRTLNFTLPNN